MTDPRLPSGCALPEGWVIDEDYEFWTVRHLLLMLEDLDPDARVWIDITPPDADDDMVITPFESFYSANGEVYLT